VKISILLLTTGLCLSSLLAQNAPSDLSIVGPQATLTPFEQSLLDAEKALIAASDRGDVQNVENTITADFISVGSNGDADSRSEFMNGVREAAGHAPRKPGAEERAILYFFQVLQLNDGAAVVSYDMVRPGDRPRYLHISDAWVQQGGRWKLRFQQETPKIWSAADLD